VPFCKAKYQALGRYVELFLGVHVAGRFSITRVLWLDSFGVYVVEHVVNLLCSSYFVWETSGGIDGFQQHAVGGQYCSRKQSITGASDGCA
jgi:hypothetical protein